ncbi:MAG: nucleotide exchange factor GrpE [archaeon]
MTKNKHEPEKATNDSNAEDAALDSTGNAASEQIKEPVQDKEKSREEVLECQLDDLTDTLQRLQAEFENYKKRIARDSIMMVKCANEDLIRTLLPVIDNFELALKSAKQKDEFYKGMEIIYSQINELLENNGLKHIQCKGVKFDPYFHEALLTEESDNEHNTVLDELQKGYMINERVIRHSKVKISKKRQSKEQSKGKDDNEKNNDDENEKIE